MGLLLQIVFVVVLGLVAALLAASVYEDWRRLPRGETVPKRLLGMLQHTTCLALLYLVAITTTVIFWQLAGDALLPADRSAMAIPILAFSLLAACASGALVRYAPKSNPATFAFTSVAWGSLTSLVLYVGHEGGSATAVFLVLTFVAIGTLAKGLPNGRR